MKMEIEGGKLLDGLKAIKATLNNEALITLKDDRWMIKSMDEAEVLMSAILVPESSMESYDKGGYDRVGIQIDKVTSFVRSRNDTIRLWMEERALHMSDGSDHARIATVDPDSVKGHMQAAPKINFEVMVDTDPDFLLDFISRQSDIVNSGTYTLGAREEGIVIYADGDNGSMDTGIEFDEFDDYTIDWSVDNGTETEGAHTPSEDHAIDVIMSSDITSQLKTPYDTCELYIANQSPMKFLFQDEDAGMKISFIQAPRIDNKGRSTIPDRTVEEVF